MAKPRYSVIPAQAGIHLFDACKAWTPACAGVTKLDGASFESL